MVNWKEKFAAFIESARLPLQTAEVFKAGWCAHRAAHPLPVIDVDRQGAPVGYVTESGITTLPQNVIEGLGLQGGGGVVFFQGVGGAWTLITDEEFGEYI